MRSGQILLALLLLIGAVGAALTGAAIYSRFIYLGIFLGAGSWAWTRWAVSGLQFKRVARIQRANVGDVFEEHFTLFNTSRIFAPWVEILNQSNIPHSAGSRLLTMALGRQQRSYVSRTWLTRRGAFSLGPTRVTSGDPFGLFRASVEFPAKQKLIVMPMLFEIKSFFFPPGLLPGGQVIRKKSADITPHAAGVREYVHGDAMKRIHWRTSIRRNQLMVKEFEQDPQAEVWLYLDLQRSAHIEKQESAEISTEVVLFNKRPEFHLAPSTLEYSVSVAASLAHYFISQRRAVGYVSAGQTFTVHSADRSERQEGKILETLAFVEADGELSIAALASAQASQLPQGSSAILITPNARADLLLAVDDLRRRYLRPLVVLIDSPSFGGMNSADTVSLELHARRVPFCIVKYGDNLTQTLSGLPVNFSSQEMQTWQRPMLSR
ncbi:MAG: DUF58 domain-containing protein [Anaerolineales bacterium]|nr:DUF58 domain-containing protein [Anaerolineales bacterium]